MSDKKIVHFAPAFTSKGGGIFEVVNCLAYEQCKNYGKSNITVIGCSDTSLAAVHTLPDGVVWDILPYNYSYLKFIRNLTNFTKIMKECDVLHVHGAWSLQFLYLLPFILLNRKYRVVYQPHGLLSSIRYKRKKYLKKILWHLYMKSIIRRSACVVSTSNTEEEEFIYYHQFADKIFCVPNAIANEFFDEPLKTKTGNEFLFLSQIIPIKGLDLLIRAFAKIISEGHNITLTIGGYGEATYVKQLKEFVEELNLVQHVVFIGPVSRDERIQIYDTHKYFILPSKNESFGLVVGEALARGCISFISDRTPWAKILDVPNLITVRPELEDMYDALKARITSDNEYSKEDAINSQDTIKIGYAWSERLEQFSSVYAWQINE